MKCLKLAVAAISLFFLAVISACTTFPFAEQANTATVKIFVTQNFGQGLILDQTVDIGYKSNALEALKRVAQVETAFGGGFVDSINGIRSKYSGFGSTQQDWFFYINGMESNIGALDYTLHPGDIEQWDFHNWSFHQSIPAIIGNFPEPFSHSEGGKTRPTLIAYDAGLREAADNIKQRLNSSGVNTIGIKGIMELSANEKESANIFLLGTSSNQLMTELNGNWKRLGFFAYLENKNLVTVNASGQVKTKYGAGTGLIQATQNPWNPNGIGAGENVVWLVSGTDAAGVKAAVDILVNHSEELKYTFAAVIVDGKLVKVPQ